MSNEKEYQEVGPADVKHLVKASEQLLRIRLIENATANELGPEMFNAEQSIDSLIHKLKCRLQDDCGCITCDCEEGQVCDDCQGENGPTPEATVLESEFNTLKSEVDGLHEQLNIAKKTIEGDADTIRSMQEQIDGMMAAANMADAELIDLRKKMAAIDDLADGGKTEAIPKKDAKKK